MTTTRRAFLELSLASAAASLASCAAPRTRPARAPRIVTGPLRHACIGVGGMGGVDLSRLSAHPNVRVVALCDVDGGHLERAAATHAGARLYGDWRELIAKEAGRIDSLNVSTPDHMHAPITLAALRMGLHVYCQKPLTHTIAEARAVTRAAERANVVTQMGIQNHSNPPYREAIRLLRGGIVGRVHAVHVWTDRPAGWWPQDVARPEGSDPVPDTLAWDHWLGVAPERPYAREAYHPFAWRGFLDFGTGAQGDMACHLVDPALWFLELGPPRSVRSEGPPDNGETYPAWTTVHTTFAPTRWTIDAPLVVSWYDGGRRAPAELLERYGAGPDVWSNACLFVGERGALLTSPYSPARVLPEERYPGVARFELAEQNHWHEWVDACSGIGTTSAPFSYAGPLTEVALLGNAALRFPGEELAWDARELRFPERREANAAVTKRYRDGWAPKGLG